MRIFVLYFTAKIISMRNTNYLRFTAVALAILFLTSAGDKCLILILKTNAVMLRNHLKYSGTNLENTIKFLNNEDFGKLHESILRVLLHNKLKVSFNIRM